MRYAFSLLLVWGGLAWGGGEPAEWTAWRKLAVRLHPETETAAGAVPKLVPRLLPGTQQPAPALLLLGAPDGEAVALAEWLHRQAVHVLFLDGVRQDDPEAAVRSVRRALRLIRSRAGGWQIDPEAVGLLARSAETGAVAVRVATAGDHAPDAAADKIDRERAAPDLVVLLNAGDGAAVGKLPEARRPELFTAQGGKWITALAEWLEPFQNDVF